MGKTVLYCYPAEPLTPDSGHFRQSDLILASDGLSRTHSE